MTNSVSLKVRVQKIGAFLSAEVMPNIGVFIGWGILAALVIPTGWLPNEKLNVLVAPTMKYLVPALIGYTGGFNIHGKRGGVIGAFATMGIILGAEMNMLAGAMFMGPASAWLLKKLDGWFDGKIKPGLEMMVNNFTLGILGVSLMIIGYLGIVPIIEFLIGILSGGVSALLSRGLLPLMALFVQPAKVLFLNNAVNHGIMIPLGIEQATQAGKSLLFMIEANNGCVLGVALAFSIFGKGTAKKAAPGAAIINFFGGIGEVVYPFVLSKPLTLLGMISGSMVSLLIIQFFGGGTVAPISPGSFFALASVSTKDTILVNIISYFAGMLVSMLVAGFFLRIDRTTEETLLPEADNALVNEAVSSQSTANNYTTKPVLEKAMIKRIVFACDAGMGSSVMGESIMKTKLKKAMLDIEVIHSSVASLQETVDTSDIIITTRPLADRVQNVLTTNSLDNQVFPVDNLLNGDTYDQLIKDIFEK
ncbi:MULTISPECIES: PTS mannitol transporter subunit IICB [Enterococcus]|uniref:PTS mannitol transporter subunit IICB n=1 Tax=Enterococcus TaxID=1350 RepID=UPI000B5A9B01|nr:MULTISPECIES: PTS mannitol transporter subunit IICB [Enterococcus]OTO15235.1 hypothetical protein A5875_004393 [Enterococcus sp. 3H8_DIV0648]